MRDRVAWAVVLVPLLLLTLPGLVTGRAPLEGDLLVYQLPIYEVLADAFAAGQFPWWDPTVQSGTPFFANPQTQLLWPLTWVHGVLPHAPALMLWLLLHGILAAVGATYWLRSRGLENGTAALGALVFVLGGPALSLVSKPDKLPAFVLIPWMLWGLQLWAAGRRRRAAALVVLAQVGMALSGGLEIWILALGGALVFVVAEREGLDRLRGAALLGLSTVLAFAIAGVQLVPFLELMGHTTRSAGIDYAAVAKWSLQIPDLAEMLVPLAFISDDDRPIRFLAHIGCGSVGAAALLAWAVRTGEVRGPRGETVAILVGVIGFLFLALGDATPVHRVAYELLPPLKSLRYPEKYVWGAWPFVALAVARGLARAPEVPIRTWIVGALGVIAVGFLAGASPRVIIAAVFTASCLSLLTSRTAMLALAALELVIVARVTLPPVDSDLIVSQGTAIDEPVPRYFNVDRHVDKRTALPPRTSAQQRLMDVSRRAWPNVGVLRDEDGRRRFEYADGVRAIRLERQDLYFDNIAPQPVPNALLLLRRAGVTALGFLTPERHDEWTAAAGVTSEFLPPHTVVRVPGFRRVGWARTAGVRTSDADAYRSLGGPDLLEERALAIEVDAPGALEALKAMTPAMGIEPPDVTMTRPAPDRFEIDVAGVGGWVVIREAWAPGWRAEYEHDGSVVELPVARADFYLQAVPVPVVERGETVRIRLSYRPAGLAMGLILSVLGLLSFLATLWASGSDRTGARIVSRNSVPRAPAPATSGPRETGQPVVDIHG